MACLLKGQIIANIGLTYIHTELSLGYYALVVAGIYRDTMIYRYFCHLGRCYIHDKAFLGDVSGVKINPKNVCSRSVYLDVVSGKFT